MKFALALEIALLAGWASALPVAKQKSDPYDLWDKGWVKLNRGMIELRKTIEKQFTSAEEPTQHSMQQVDKQIQALNTAPATIEIDKMHLLQYDAIPEIMDMLQEIVHGHEKSPNAEDTTSHIIPFRWPRRQYGTLLKHTMRLIDEMDSLAKRAAKSDRAVANPAIQNCITKGAHGLQLTRGKLQVILDALKAKIPKNDMSAAHMYLGAEFSVEEDRTDALLQFFFAKYPF